jgi:hypothetical protein
MFQVAVVPITIAVPNDTGSRITRFTGVTPTRPITRSIPVAGSGAIAESGVTCNDSGAPLRTRSSVTDRPGEAETETASTTAFPDAVATPFTAVIESPAAKPARPAGIMSTTVAITGRRYCRRVNAAKLPAPFEARHPTFQPCNTRRTIRSGSFKNSRSTVTCSHSS